MRVGAQAGRAVDPQQPRALLPGGACRSSGFDPDELTSPDVGVDGDRKVGPASASWSLSWSIVTWW